MIWGGSFQFQQFETLFFLVFGEVENKIVILGVVGIIIAIFRTNIAIFRGGMDQRTQLARILKATSPPRTQSNSKHLGPDRVN